MTPHRTLPVLALVNRLGRKEQTLKRAGAFAEAAGIRDAVTEILRMADETPPAEPSLETPGDTP